MRDSRSLRAARMAASGIGLLLAAPARAQQPAAAPSGSPLTLSWATEDASCPGTDVAQRALGMVTPGVEPRPLRASVQLRRDGSAWLVELQTQGSDPGSSGRRNLRAESCDELEKAIALLLAMTLESREEEPSLPPSVTPAPATPAPEPPAPDPSEDLDPELDEPPPAPPTESPGVRLGAFLRLDGKAGLLLQPGLALGAGVAAGVRVGAFDIGASGTYWPATREPVLARGGSLDVERSSLGLRGCYNAALGHGFILAPCLRPEVSFLRYETVDVFIPGKGKIKPLGSLTGSVDLRFELVEDTLSVALGGALTWERPQPLEIGLQNDTDTDGEVQKVQVYETKGIGPRLEIGVDARF